MELSSSGGISKGFALVTALIQVQSLDVACQSCGQPMPTEFVPAMLPSSSSLVMVVTAQCDMCPMWYVFSIFYFLKVSLKTISRGYPSGNSVLSILSCFFNEERNDEKEIQIEFPEELLRVSTGVCPLQ